LIGLRKTTLGIFMRCSAMLSKSKLTRPLRKNSLLPW
jgi:hypothetical protein